MTASLQHPGTQRALREFCGAVYGAQCLVAAGEHGPRVSALLRYASTLLDAIDIDLLEAGTAPDDPALLAVARLRERYDRLVLAMLTVTLRRRASRVQRAAPAGKEQRRRRHKAPPAAPAAAA